MSRKTRRARSNSIRRSTRRSVRRTKRRDTLRRKNKRSNRRRNSLRRTNRRKSLRRNVKRTKRRNEKYGGAFRSFGELVKNWRIKPQNLPGAATPTPPVATQGDSIQLQSELDLEAGVGPGSVPSEGENLRMNEQVFINTLNEIRTRIQELGETCMKTPSSEGVNEWRGSSGRPGDSEIPSLTQAVYEEDAALPAIVDTSSSQQIITQEPTPTPSETDEGSTSLSDEEEDDNSLFDTALAVEGEGQP